MKNLPEKLYLQIGEEADESVDFNDLYGVSWCDDKIYENDVVYVREDIVIKMLENDNEHQPPQPGVKRLKTKNNENKTSWRTFQGRGRDAGSKERKQVCWMLLLDSVERLYKEPNSRRMWRSKA